MDVSRQFNGNPFQKISSNGETKFGASNTQKDLVQSPFSAQPDVSPWEASLLKAIREQPLRPAPQEGPPHKLDTLG